MTSPFRSGSTEARWVDFHTSGADSLTPESQNRSVAEVAVSERSPSVGTREAMTASMVGDREPIAVELPAARTAVEQSNPDAEREWALARLERFHSDGNPLSDADGARMLIGLENLDTRDALWEDMSLTNAASHSALWQDLTRRAPDQVRTPAASMLGFASWLHRDVARAWCALEQAPDGQSYTMALTLATALETATDPQQWERIRGLIESPDVEESFIPKPRTTATAPSLRKPHLTISSRDVEACSKT